MSNKIRVVHIINSFEFGGAEAMLCNLLLRCDRTRFEPSVVSLIDDLRVAGPVLDAGIPLVTMGMRPGVPDPRGVARLTGHLRRLRPQVVQTWMDHSNLIGALAARAGAPRARVVWGIHHSDHVRGVAKRSTLLTVAACARISRRLTSAIVCCSQHAAALYGERGFARDRLTVIPNGFDTTRFHPDPDARRDVRRELGVSPDTTLIGLVARYDPFKDHANFISAAALLAGRFPDARFVLCGDKVDGHNETLTAQIEALGLTNRCHLLGNRRDVPRIHAALDVATSSSISEAFPLVVGEAMACGVPCVATDVGDSALIVGDTGRIVPPRDPRALAEAWAGLLEMGADARQQLGAAARARVCELFDLGAVTRRYEALYGELVDGKGQNGSLTAPSVPSPLYSGERARVRGPCFVGSALADVVAAPGSNGTSAKADPTELQTQPPLRPLTPALSPEYRGEGVRTTSRHANGNGRHAPRPLRVLMVVESSAGGTGRHVLDLSEGLLARGCDVHLVYSTNRIDRLFMDRLGGITGLRHTPLPMRTSIHPNDMRVVRAVRRYLDRQGPFDAIHGHSSKGGALARLAALGTAVPAFYTLHGLIMMDPGLAPWKRRFYLAIERGLSLRTSRIIAVSPEEARAAVRLGLGRSRIAMVPNGVGPADLTPRPAARRVLDVPDDALVIGFVGRLVEQKAPHVLIEAFAATAKVAPHVVLALVGAGPLEEPMRELAARLGVTHKVRWLGERDARGVLAAFDAFALSSRKEGLPYVVLEAMAAGLPVVATASAGVEILIEPGVNGMVVPTDDAGAFARALIELATDPQRLARCGRASRERAARFTIDAMVDRTLAAYSGEAMPCHSAAGAVGAVATPSLQDRTTTSAAPAQPPSPGTPGEGRGEGVCDFGLRIADCELGIEGGVAAGPSAQSKIHNSKSKIHRAPTLTLPRRTGGGNKNGAAGAAIAPPMAPPQDFVTPPLGRHPEQAKDSDRQEKMTMVTKAAKPRSAQLHPGPGFRIRTDFVRPDAALIEAFREFPTPDISDLLNRLYAVDPQIRCLTGAHHALSGPACTVKVFPGDNLMVHKSLDIAKPGDIVVVDAGGSGMNAVLGDLVSAKARHRGIAGFIIDGLIRDLPSITALDFPVFARGSTPIGPLHRGPGEINYPICCGGIVVNPGDLIVGDAAGVIVVPREIAPELLQRLQQHKEANRAYFESIRRGDFSNEWVDRLLREQNCPVTEEPVTPGPNDIVVPVAVPAPLAPPDVVATGLAGDLIEGAPRALAKV